MLNVMAERVFSEFAEVAGRRGLPFLPVKGVVTARWLYDDVADRPLSDVDIRVRPSDLDAFEAAGREAGWVLVRRSDAYASLVFALGGMSVDIESSVGPPGLSGLAVDAMLSRSTRTRALFGFEHALPEIHDHALLLVVNAFKDKIVHAGPGALTDLARIVARRDFDPGTFVDLAERTSNVTEAFLVASWMSEKRGYDHWRRLRDVLEPKLKRPVYVALVRRLIDADDPFPGALRVLARWGADDFRLRARAVLRMAHLAWERPGAKPRSRGSS